MKLSIAGNEMKRRFINSASMCYKLSGVREIKTAYIDSSAKLWSISHSKCWNVEGFLSTKIFNNTYRGAYSYSWASEILVSKYK
jgi:hypothetical protein